MNYYKIITYAEGKNEKNEIETRERLVDENVYRLIQLAMKEDVEFIDLGAKGIIRRSSIKEIAPANDIVNEYQKIGVQIDGLLEPVSVPRLTGGGGLRNIQELIKENHESFYKKMGWNHDQKDCNCHKPIGYESINRAIENR